MTDYKKAFFEKMHPYAERAEQELDIPESVILAQWAVESDYGRSSLAKRANNMAGIKYVPGVSIAEGRTGPYARYRDLNQFVDDYIRVMKLGYYEKVRKAKGVEETVRKLAKSPYAESGYGGGGSLLSIIAVNELVKYDGPDMIWEVPKIIYTDTNNNEVKIPVSGVDKNNLGWLIILAGVALMAGLTEVITE